MTIAIVDPFSSGRHLAPILKNEFGVDCVAILSSDNLPKFYLNTFKATDFSQVFQDPSTETLAESLKAKGVTAVIAGSEPGVLLADALAEKLGLRRNHPALSSARRNKYLMLEAVRRQGLRAAKQVSANHVDQALTWIHANLNYPVVLKPQDSAGTDGVTLCDSDSEVQAYFAKHLHQKNLLTLTINEILVQEYLLGVEHVVDTVSCDGQHQVVAVWRYKKGHANGSPFVYDTMQLVNQLGPQEEAVIQYTLACLDALGMANGPAHSEVMLTETGPSLIEVGARIHGGNGTVISGACVGYNQIDRTALLNVNASQFVKSLRPRYATDKSALEIFMISHTQGTYVSLKDEGFIRSLPTFHALTFNLVAGDKLPLTVDLISSPGRVVLIGEPEQIAKDYAAVRSWEKAGAYEVR